MQSKAAFSKKKAKKSKSKPPSQLSNTRKPANLSFEEWQILLRKQIVERSSFKIKKVGDGSVYSDYTVLNTVNNSLYKVALRSSDNSINYCSCYDFKTNQLGTCKHIEAVLKMIRKKPLLRKQLSQAYTTDYSSMYLEYRGQRKVVFRIGTENSVALKRLLKPYTNEKFCLNEYGVECIDEILKKALRINPQFRPYEDALGHIIELREKNRRKELLLPYIKKNKLPLIRSLKVTPFTYQIEGILFCALAGRSILADDMGLGKTIQAIGVSQLMYEIFNIQKVLIICPTSLKYQWQSEIEKFTPSTVQVVEGVYSSRKIQYTSEKSFYKIASYHAAVNDIQLINDYQPDLIILDEAQRIKNWQTRVSQSIKKLKSKYALVLTGTPLENKIQELYSLVQFINPLQLGSLYNFTSKHEQTDDTGKVIGYKDLHLIKDQLKDILLRRTKKQVLSQLPSRHDKNLFVDITPEQKIVHQEYMDIVSKLVNRWKKMGFLREEDRQRLLISLNAMRMVCNSTFILDQQTNHQTKLDELFNILDEIVNNTDEKIVIFSQWERFTRLIAERLDLQEIKYSNLNGNVPGAKRKALFDSFNNDPECRIFLSTDAGGVGLNLQTGSVVINMDLPWNPAVLEQRIARVYRQGQKRSVSVINFVAQNTIEHSMLGKLKFKKALAEGILDNGDANIFIGDSKFNVFMQSVEELIVSDTAQQVPPSIQQEEIETERNFGQAEIVPIDFEENQNTEVKATIREAMIPSDTAQSGGAEKELLQSASSFFSQLTKVLNDKDATQRFAQSLMRKDDNTGQTYLQIPVESEAIIVNAVELLSSLLRHK